MSETRQPGVKLNSVYFIGIGGIGMSAIARYFHSKGVGVSGYDKTPTPLTRELEATGIPIHYEENVAMAPKDAELVVYTPAIPAEHKELQYFRANGYRVVKRSDVLQIITESSFNICIAGTHGKTTITTLVAHLLRDTGYGCNAFLGGISVNYGTNFWSSERNVCVVEADEYDRSFLKLNPDIAIITSMDPDHLDIYGTAESVEQGFIDFSRKVKPGGLLVSKLGLKREKDLKADRHLTYSLQGVNADVYAKEIRLVNGSYVFDVVTTNGVLENVTLNMGGLHNVENTVAAIAAVSSLPIDKEKIKAGIASFRGVKRRFEYLVRKSQTVFIDDYAHHPEELRALVSSARSLFPEMTCTVIFQPHLYTRTRDHATGFAEVLDMADEVILLPIYPARELPIAGVNSEMILEKMKKADRRIVAKEKLVDWVKNEYAGRAVSGKGQLLVTAGAGDIDTLLEPVQQVLMGR
jgi:UDP-N-acetylmuramate--alanine ligase